MSGRWTARARLAWPLAVVAAAAVVAALLAGPPGREGPPLDPRSTAGSGTRGLVSVLAELGAEVEVTDTLPAPGDPGGAALLLTDLLDDAERDDLLAWVRASGATLVVADVGSPLAPEVVGGTGIGFLDVTVPRRCDVPALAGVERVSVPGGMVFDVPDGATACFPRGDGHWLVGVPEGAGTVVSLGGPVPFVNRELASADNSVLVGALLAPEPGTRVLFIRPGLPGEGDAALADLISDSVRFALVQLGIAFAILVLWRARRLGKPVTEPQPVQIAGSELVTAVGNLLQQGQARSQAAQLLVTDLLRSLTDRLGLPPGTDPGAVADAAASRTRLDRDELTGLLARTDPPDDASLVALAQLVEQVRARVLAGPAPQENPEQGAASAR